MWSWRKKTPINSDEYETLTKKFVAMVSDIDILSNRVAILHGDYKTLTAKLAALKRDKIELSDENENNKKDTPHYI